MYGALPERRSSVVRIRGLTHGLAFKVRGYLKPAVLGMTAALLRKQPLLLSF